MSLAPPDSLVLCYQGRSVAILRPADLNELREQTRSIFGLSTTNDRRHSHDSATTTRSILRFFYYTTAAPAVAPVSRQVPQATSSKKRQKREDTIEVKREEKSQSTLPCDNAAETDEEDNGDVKEIKPLAIGEVHNTGPSGRQRKRELGETLLPRLPDDFELHVEIVNVPIKRLGIRDGQAHGSQRASSKDSSLLSEENLARLNATTQINAQLNRPVRSRRRRSASSAHPAALPPFAGNPPEVTETGMFDRIDGVWRCYDCDWEIVSGECASCARKYIMMPASRHSQPFERESCPVCDHEVVRGRLGYLCSDETCPFDCPSEGNSEYSDVTAAAEDHHYGSDSDTGTETHIYGHNPAIDYASSISEVSSPTADVSSSEEFDSSDCDSESLVTGSEASRPSTDCGVPPPVPDTKHTGQMAESIGDADEIDIDTWPIWGQSPGSESYGEEPREDLGWHI